MSFVYYILKNISQAVQSLYFRKVFIVGIENVPKDGPVIICGNHANQFIDPIMIGSCVDRHLSFTMASSSFNKPIIGSLAKLAHAIPVKRPEDSKVKGKGKIKISGNQINGINTNFYEDSKMIGDGFSILIDSKIIQIKSIINEITLEIVDKQENLNFANKELEFYVSSS